VTETEVAGSTLSEARERRSVLDRDRDSLRFAEAADELRRQGRVSEATSVCARGLSRRPQYATGHVVMGEIFRDGDLPEKAEQEWAEALRLDPGHPRAHLLLGQLYLARGESARAAAALEAALLSNPACPEARALLAEARGEPAAEKTGGEVETAPEPTWRPGERPAWLTADSLDQLAESVAACRSVESAMLANSDGLPLAGRVSSSVHSEVAAGMAVELMLEARELAACLGAGRLQRALVRGRHRSIRCLALGDYTLIALLDPNCAVGTADAEIEEILANAGRAPAGD
jgi:predicted regulator of Ras-like GTPase activity (Roadblock/LC7/MglB family)